MFNLRHCGVKIAHVSKWDECEKTKNAVGRMRRISCIFCDFGLFCAHLMVLRLEQRAREKCRPGFPQLGQQFTDNEHNLKKDESGYGIRDTILDMDQPRRAADPSIC